jgi:fumarylacetoacetase
MSALDETHDPARRSWVASANGHPDFPIQNLPFGVFTPPGGGERRGGVAIGSSILDISSPYLRALLTGEATIAAEKAAGRKLNDLFGLGPGPRRALRRQLSALLVEEGGNRALESALYAAAECTLHMPAAIGDYTDFYVGIQHATNVGKLFRPDNPLLPNYKWVPIGYHGRASSVRPSGTPIRRPNGQRKRPDRDEPDFGPSERLDYELELGVWIGPGSELGDPIPIGEAASHIAGYCLLNDWSARDIQAWEYQPLGPFLSKNFGSVISPWVITPEALAPFAIALTRPAGDPAPLPYLSDDADQQSGALDLELEVLLLTPGLRERGLEPHRLSASNAKHMYWTAAQMVAHHTCNGCDLNPGDLLGSGTISAPDATGFGSLLESTEGGKNPVRLASGEERRFVEDGDEVILRARAVRDGFVPVGFGECRGAILPAHARAG